jgi:hypothetical protein
MKLRGSSTKLRGNVKRNIIFVAPRLKGVQNLSEVTAELAHDTVPLL